jgi:hypothetical protein
MRTLSLSIVLLLISSYAALGASDEDRALSLLHEAGRSYLAGEYLQARDHYQQLAKIVPSPSWQTHYNLGNTYFRLNDLGRAIFYFRQAYRLSPRNPNVIYNLKYSREQVGKVDSGTQVSSLLLLPLSLRESLILSTLLTMLLVLFVIILRYRQIEWVRWGRNLALLMLLYPLTYGAKLYFFTPEIGVVTVKEASVYSGSGVDNVVLFKLDLGSEFELLDGGSTISDKWVLVQIGDGKRGWVHRQQVVTSIK